MYRENDWVYVIGQDSPRQEGFIPHSYCAPYDLAIKKKLPRNGNVAFGFNETEVADVNSELVNSNDSNLDIHQSQSSIKQSSQGSLDLVEPEILPFAKDPSGRFIVLYTFIARDENDVSVERGEFVTGKYAYEIHFQKISTNFLDNFQY